MNNARRKRIAQLTKTALLELENLLEEEQEAIDNLPESLQQSERGNDMEEAVAAIEEGIFAIEELRDAF